MEGGSLQLWPRGSELFDLDPSNLGDYNHVPFILPIIPLPKVSCLH